MTAVCPDHGEQQITHLGYWTVTLACGAVGSSDGGWEHA